MKTVNCVLDQGKKDMGQPAISVLVPVYNVEAYLQECLNSLINQTFENIEIICVDDGSTDNSGIILDRYAASDFRLKVIHKLNTGYGNSMNVALNQAAGKYIAVLESDDFAELDMLERLYNEAEIQGADVVKGNHYDYQEGENLFLDRLKNYPKGQVINVFSCPELLNLADTIWSCLYKRDFLLKYEICFHETLGASYQDISFALQVWIQAEKVYFIGDALLHYRRDNPMSSMNNPSKLFCVFDEYEWAAEKMRRILDANFILHRYFIASKYRDYFNHYYRVGLQYQYALLLRLEETFYEDRRNGRISKSVFIPDVWDKLCELAADRDYFFRRTAKSVPDSRLSMCHFKNNKIYIEAFYEHLKIYPQIFVYGAGRVGKRLAKWILNQDGRIDAFLVTDIENEKRDCMGIPVIEVQAAGNLANTCAVVIAVTEWSQYEIYEVLEKYGFCNIFRVDSVIRESI